MNVTVINELTEDIDIIDADLAIIEKNRRLKPGRGIAVIVGQKVFRIEVTDRGGYLYLYKRVVKFIKEKLLEKRRELRKIYK